MTFKWKISRPPFHSVASGVEVMHAGIETEFETGSIAEAHGIFQDNGNAMTAMFGSSVMSGVSGIALAASDAVASEAQGEQNNEVATTTRRRRRNNGANPDAANAPDPVTIPGGEAPPVVPDAATAAQAAAATAAISAPPPAPPAAAPIAPPPPPPPTTGPLATKIADELTKRGAGSGDGGTALAGWLVTNLPDVVIKGASLAEAIDVIRFTTDDKLAGIGGALFPAAAAA